MKYEGNLTPCIPLIRGTQSNVSGAKGLVTYRVRAGYSCKRFAIPNNGRDILMNANAIPAPMGVHIGYE
jgi:hypothetical protein